MCSYINHQIAIDGSAKGGQGWFNLAEANVYFDHPYHANLEHALTIDFMNPKDGSRVAIEMSAESAALLAETILQAIKDGHEEAGIPVPALAIR
jgi:hypothetical protein